MLALQNIRWSNSHGTSLPLLVSRECHVQAASVVKLFFFFFFLTNGAK
jgi:hypothetical protein